MNSDFETRQNMFLESLRVRNYSALTLLGYRNRLQNLLGYLLKENVSDLPEVTEEISGGYQRWLMNQSLAMGSVALYLTAVFKFFRWLEEKSFILVNPCARLQIPKQPQRLPKPVLTCGEVHAILSVPDVRTPRGVRDRALLELFYSSGLRVSEMTNLCVHDLDLKNGFVRVIRGKGRRDRVVPIGEKACQILRCYVQEVRPLWLKTSRSLHNHLWLSPIQPHQVLKKESIAWIVRRTAKETGMSRNASPHLWRHTFATHLVSSGANIAQAQRLLGHRSIKTTEVYMRVTVPEIKASMQKAHPRNRVRLKSSLLSPCLKSPFKRTIK